jgi:hypothetical protein
VTEFDNIDSSTQSTEMTTVIHDETLSGKEIKGG